MTRGVLRRRYRQNCLIWKCGWTNSPPFMLELKDNKPLDLVLALCELVGLIYKYIVLNFQRHWISPQFTMLTLSWFLAWWQGYTWNSICTSWNKILLRAGACKESISDSKITLFYTGLWSGENLRCKMVPDACLEITTLCKLSLQGCFVYRISTTSENNVKLSCTSIR
jgi:hypothetical protein